MRFENRSFKNETLVLDGNEYINCNFENIVFTYSASGEGGKIEPLIMQGFTLKYEGAAKAATELHQTILAIGLRNAPMGSHLRVGDAWFRRVEQPTKAGDEAGKTDGMAIVV